MRAFTLLSILCAIISLAQAGVAARAEDMVFYKSYGAYDAPSLIDKPRPCDSVIRPTSQTLTKSWPVTTLEFEITAEGSVQDVRVVEPSGNADYDQSWADCIKTWRYHPALRNGVPIDVRWGTKITWASGFILFDLPAQIAAPTYAAIQNALLQCAKSPPPTAQQLASASAPSRLQLLTFGGRIESMALVSSSGNRDLDARAMHCLEISSANPVTDSSARRQFPFSIYWDQYASW